MPSEELERLERENAELRQRLELAESAIETLRREAAARRLEVRELAEQLPAAMSRRSLLRAMLHDVRVHPDKTGVARRAVRKLGRAPRKAGRLVVRRRST